MKIHRKKRNQVQLLAPRRCHGRVSSWQPSKHRRSVLGRTGIWVLGCMLARMVLRCVLARKVLGCMLACRSRERILDGMHVECQDKALEWQGWKLRRAQLETPEREEVESRNKSESSLILGYLTIQCHAFKVRIDVFSTAQKREKVEWSIESSKIMND